VCDYPSVLPQRDEQLMNLGDLRALVAGVSRKTIHKWLCDKIIPAPIQIGGRNYWYRAEISAWLAQQRRADYAQEPQAA
jgi:predicted DNA-binding transcriptional regulator AlpA